MPSGKQFWIVSLEAGRPARRMMTQSYRSGIESEKWFEEVQAIITVFDNEIALNWMKEWKKCMWKGKKDFQVNVDELMGE